ncbi:hypothetical protein TNCV_1785761 [Trichonephila clavipes]|nr:hypothetical protein TNCV_1785761 [Trichonephila clavipes]
MKIWTRDSNAKLFQLLLEISSKVTRVSEIRIQILVPHLEMQPMATLGSLTPASSVSEGGITVIRHYSANIREFLKSNFSFLYLTHKNTRKNEHSLFLSGLKVNQKNAKLYNNVGHCLETQGKYSEALTYFNTAIEIAIADSPDCTPHDFGQPMASEHVESVFLSAMLWKGLPAQVSSSSLDHGSKL